MRKIVISTQNVLLSDALIKHLNDRGDIQTQRTPCPFVDGEVLKLCKAVKPDALLLEVSYTSQFTYDERIKGINIIRTELPECKIALLCDENVNPELAEKITTAKKLGIIDAFFYSSVSWEYLTAALEAL